MASSRPAAGTLSLIAMLTLVWGTNWALFPIVAREVSVWTFRAVSMSGAALLLLAIARLRGESLRIPREQWGTVVLAACLYLVVWNIASTYAAILIPSGQAAILGFTMPLWVALTLWVVDRQVPDRRTFAALVLGGAGVVLLMIEGLPAYAAAPAGFALGLLAGLGWALGTVLLKRRPPTATAMVLTGWQLLVAAVPIAIGALWHDHGAWQVPSVGTVLLIVYIMAVPMSIGNAAWFAIVGRLPAHVAGMSSVMVPMVAMVTGAIVHREPLGVVQWLAMACCGGGLVLAVVRRG